MHVYVTVCRGLENNVADMEVVKEFDSIQHKPVVFEVILGKTFLNLQCAGGVTSSEWCVAFTRNSSKKKL